MGNGTAGGSRRSKKKKVRWVGRGGGEGYYRISNSWEWWAWSVC